jgi:hypothetical protein
MTYWAVSPSMLDASPQAEEFLLALGKSLYVATQFEGKVQSVFRFFNLIDWFEEIGDSTEVFAQARAAKDQMLGRALKAIKEHRLTRSLTAEVSTLETARHARNYIAHEAAGKIHSLEVMRAADVAKALAALREEVIKLAQGDNIISRWEFEISEKQPASMWFVDTYEARVLNWIFGDPFPESENDLHYRSAMRAEKAARDAGLSGNELLRELLRKLTR